jgi:hypothetical protein
MKYNILYLTNCSTPLTKIVKVSKPNITEVIFGSIIPRLNIKFSIDLNNKIFKRLKQRITVYRIKNKDIKSEVQKENTRGTAVHRLNDRMNEDN